MCGVAGALQSGLRDEQWQQRLAEMGRRLAHRGPDDDGLWCDADAGVGLAHRRLAILDISARGRQPMTSASGRYRMVYNGEIYNFRALRDDLRSRGNHFQTGTDTEVLLAAIESWGLEDALPKCNGMFAFALWDRKDRRLYLARDRIGIKPLYYGWQGKCFLFASELKALKCHPEFRREIDRSALILLLKHGYIPSPHSIYQNIYKLLPGTILTINPAAIRRTPPPRPYWSAHQVVEQGRQNPFPGSEAEALEALTGLLKDAVNLRMIADVPLGAFLSGGYDSSTVVALMQSEMTRPVKTYTIGFRESGFDEAKKARAVADHLGTDHRELYLDAGQAIAVIPRLPEMYDEPFGDSSQIPTFLVSELARQSVTVSLSGDGGDELFCGYHHYQSIRHMEQQSASPAKLWKNLQAKLVQPLVHWESPGKIVRGASEPPTLATMRDRWPDLPDFTQLRMYLDLALYLPGDILTKLDRASMAAGLEARVPLLDHRVVEFAWRLPFAYKLRDGSGKWILRKVLYRFVPPALADGAKMGFTVPIADWLGNELRPWAESLLDESRLRQEGFFKVKPVRDKWRKYLNQEENWLQNALWTVLMFQAWLENERKP